MSERSILVVGNGRLATHLCHYFKAKGLPFSQWTRLDHIPLKKASRNARLVCLAVRDDAIKSLSEQLSGKECVHFSGSLYLEGVLGLHPLMTFSYRLFKESFYDQIPLMADHPIADFPWFQKLPNKKFFIDPSQKNLYHGLCHLAGNYPKFLWLEIAKVFESNLKLPPEVLGPFLQEILNQSLAPDADPVTGPFGRKDIATIDAHLKALHQVSHLKTSYEGFLASFTEVQP